MFKRVLIYEPFVLWYHHFVTSLEIALEHLRNGDKVYFLVCKSNLLTCQENSKHNLNLCTICIANLLNGLKKINFPKENVIYLDLERYRKDIRLPEFRSLDEFKNFEIDGVDFGQAAYSSLVSLIREPFPDIEEHRELINKMLTDEIAIYNYLNELFSSEIYDLMYLFNGRYSTQRPFVRAAQKFNIKFFTHERGLYLDTYCLIEDTYIHDINFLKKDIEDKWNLNSNYEEKEKIATEYYSRRFKGWGGSWYSFVENQKVGKLPENFDNSKINIAIYNSSEDEYVGFKEYYNELFKRELDLFENIIKLSKNKNIHYYLRVHPNLKGLNNSQIRAIKSIKGKYNNLTVIDADSDISTYDLMKACDKIIVTTSTVGLEANFLGKVVISLGVSYYDSLNIAYKPQTYEEIISLIENKNLLPLPREGSIKYIYWFYKISKKYKYYKPEAINGGRFIDEYINYHNTDNKTLIDILEKIYYSNFKPIENQEDLVSVIMPAYNSEKTLYDSALSVLNQSYKNIELIIVNDGSKDNTENIAKKLIEEDNRVVYVKQENKGVAAARNKCISISKGKYIKFLDSDDLLFKNSIELLVQEINKSNSKIVFGNYIINNNSLIELSTIRNKIQINKNEFLIKQLIGNIIATGTVLIEKSILNDIGYFDENLRGPEDYDLWNRIIQKYDYTHVNIPIYIYMIYPGEQITKNIEKLRYYTDIAANKLLSKLDLKYLFSDYTNNINEIPKLSDELINQMLERPDTCYDTILKLIDKIQKISFSKNRENKKLEVINHNNLKLVNYIIELYKNIEINNFLDLNLLEKNNKLSLNKIFFIKNYTQIIRDYYQNSFLNFYIETGHKIISSSWYLSLLPKQIINYINLNVDLVLTPSNYVLDNLANLGIDPYKIKVLNQFIDYDIFKPIDISKNKEFIFIYSGKITYLSGIDILIESFKEEFQNDNAKLIIHSNGIYDIDYLENLEIQVNDKVQIMKNNFSDIELNEFINKSSCFVYPYRLEGSLLDILKPIACNIPIILTDNCISKDLPCNLINTVCSEYVENQDTLLSGLNTTGIFSYYEVDKKSLKKTMRDIYSNYLMYKEKSIQLRQYILNNYNKQKSLITLKTSIEEIKNEPSIKDNLDYFEKVWYKKANQLMESQDFTLAKKYFEILLSYKEYNQYFYKLALCLYKQNKYKEAIELFTKALYLGYRDKEILNYICEILYKIGDIDTLKIISMKFNIKINENL